MLMKLKQKKNKNYLRQKINYNIYICLFFSVLNYLREKHQKRGLLIAFR